MKLAGKLSLLIICALSMASMPAKASIEQTLANICEVVKTNDKSSLRKKMKAAKSDFNLKLADYYGGISCGGNSMIRYALINNAVDTGTLLVKKLSKKVLKAPEGDGQTVADWANANGHGGSAIFAAITDRVN